MKNFFSMEFSRIEPNQKDIVLNFLDGKLPLPIVKLGRQLGLEIYETMDLGNNISGEIRQNKETKAGYEINVSYSDLKVRKRFTIAHEIAHYLIHRDLIGDGIVDDALYRSGLQETIEFEANRLAADLLMPISRVKKEHDRIKDYEYFDKLIVLSGKFGVSKIAMQIRLEPIGIFEFEE